MEEKYHDIREEVYNYNKADISLFLNTITALILKGKLTSMFMTQSVFRDTLSLTLVTPTGIQSHGSFGVNTYISILFDENNGRVIDVVFHKIYPQKGNI